MNKSVSKIFIGSLLGAVVASPIAIGLYIYTGAYNSMLDGTLVSLSSDLILKSVLLSVFLFALGSLGASFLFSLVFYGFSKIYKLVIGDRRVFLVAVIYGLLFVLTAFLVDYVSTLLKSQDNQLTHLFWILYVCLGIGLNLVVYKKAK